MKPSIDKPAVPERIYGTVMIALVLYIIDVLMFNQGVIAMITVFIIAFIFIPQMLFALYKKDETYLIRKGMKTAIYGAMAMAILVSNGLNNKLARSRANDVIAAVGQYEAKHQKFPARLEELVPEFLPKVPRAKFGGMTSGEFRYRISGKGQPVLEYMFLPPLWKALL